MLTYKRELNPNHSPSTHFCLPPPIFFCFSLSSRLSFAVFLLIFLLLHWSNRALVSGLTQRCFVLLHYNKCQIPVHCICRTFMQTSSCIVAPLRLTPTHIYVFFFSMREVKTYMCDNVFFLCNLSLSLMCLLLHQHRTKPSGAARIQTYKPHTHTHSHPHGNYGNTARYVWLNLKRSNNMCMHSPKHTPTVMHKKHTRRLYTADVMMQQSAKH